MPLSKYEFLENRTLTAMLPQCRSYFGHCNTIRRSGTDSRWFHWKFSL